MSETPETKSLPTIRAGRQTASTKAGDVSIFDAFSNNPMMWFYLIVVIIALLALWFMWYNKHTLAFYAAVELPGWWMTNVMNAVVVFVVYFLYFWISIMASKSSQMGVGAGEKGWTYYILAAFIAGMVLELIAAYEAFYQLNWTYAWKWEALSAVLTFVHAFLAYRAGTGMLTTIGIGIMGIIRLAMAYLLYYIGTIQT